MKILVIGNGFVATPIIHRLESEGHNILIFSKSLKNDFRSRQITGNIFDFDDFVKVLSWKPQIIIHTAWVTAQEVYMSDPSNYRYSRFTCDLAGFIKQSDVEHLIVLGSCAEYGPQINPSVAGITKLSPNSIYGEQKVAAFNLVKDALHESNIRLSWVRIFQPFGPGQDKKRLLPQLVDALKNGREVILKNTSSVHDWITTRDIAAVISWIIYNDTPTEIDAGTALGFTNVQILERLEAFFGNSNQWMRYERQIPENGVVAVVGKTSPIFLSGWRASDNLDSGFKWVLDS